jgi:hypothetical protein
MAQEPVTIRILVEIVRADEADDRELGRVTLDGLASASTEIPRMLRDLADELEATAGIRPASERKPLVKWTPGLQAMADQMAMPADERRTMSIRQEPFTDETDRP